ncbi:hypothetical protein HA402_007458 [Bradysia odoriphaga]|nr:hypothetical protein HA402_007458 [Bradysia odoriphaga]
MVLRFLLRYFANNEQLVQRLSESYPIRRAAQLLVAAFLRSKNVAEQRGINDLSPDKLRRILTQFKTNLKEEIEDIKKKK